jgi:hypothetical protein
MPKRLAATAAAPHGAGHRHDWRGRLSLHDRDTTRKRASVSSELVNNVETAACKIIWT